MTFFAARGIIEKRHFFWIASFPFFPPFDQMANKLVALRLHTAAAATTAAATAAAAAVTTTTEQPAAQLKL